MQTLTLEVTQGKYPDVRSARAADRIPMVYYGKGVKNINFSVPYQEFRRIYNKGGKSTIIKLVDENKKEFPVLVHEIQYHPVTDLVMHVDLLAVDMNKPIQAQIPLKFVGVAPAVKDLGGVFVHNRTSVKVKCLPKDLIQSIEVDISALVDFHTSLLVRDIKVPAGIEIVEAPTVNIAMVSAPRDIEAEEAAMKAEDEALKVAAAAKAAGEAAAAEGAPVAAAPAVAEGAPAAEEAKAETKEKE